MSKFTHYEALFDASQIPSLVLMNDRPHFTILEANEAYCRLMQTNKNELIGKRVFEAFPPTPFESDSDAALNMKNSLEQVMAFKTSHTLTVQKYSIAVHGTLEFQLKYWSYENSPVLNEQGDVILIMHAARDITDQILAQEREKKANMELVKSQEQYLSLFHNNPDAVFSFSTDGRFTSANKVLAQLAECSLEELMVKTFIPFVAPEDLEKVTAHFQKACTGEIQNYHTRAITAMGKRLVLNVTNLPIVVNNAIVGVYGIAKDVTKTVQADNDLKQSRAELQKIMDSSLDLICTIDENGKFMKVSKASLRLLGYLPDELEGKLYSDLADQSDQETQERMSIDMKAGLVLRFENRWKRKDGEVIIMSWSAYWDDTDKVAYCVGRDITERVKAEENVRKTEEINRLIMNSALDAIICMKPNGHVTLWNSQAETLFGWTSEQMLGKDLADFVLPEKYRKTLKDTLRQYIKNGESTIINKVVEVYAVNHKQVEFPIELIIIFIENAGKPFYCAFIRDITQRKQYISEIEDQNIKLREIAWAQSHVVRAPLSRILGIVDLINRHSVDSSSELFGALFASATELDEVVRGIVKKTNNPDRVLNADRVKTL